MEILQRIFADHENSCMLKPHIWFRQIIACCVVVSSLSFMVTFRTGRLNNFFQSNEKNMFSSKDFHFLMSKIKYLLCFHKKVIIAFNCLQSPVKATWRVTYIFLVWKPLRTFKPRIVALSQFGDTRSEDFSSWPVWIFHEMRLLVGQMGCWMMPKIWFILTWGIITWADCLQTLLQVRWTPAISCCAPAARSKWRKPVLFAL